VSIRDEAAKPVLSFTQMLPNRASDSVNRTFVLDFYFKSSDLYALLAVGPERAFRLCVRPGIVPK
jgi:hypothetical protein